MVIVFYLVGVFGLGVFIGVVWGRVWNVIILVVGGVFEELWWYYCYVCFVEVVVNLKGVRIVRGSCRKVEVVVLVVLSGCVLVIVVIDSVFEVIVNDIFYVVVVFCCGEEGEKVV